MSLGGVNIANIHISLDETRIDTNSSASNFMVNAVKVVVDLGPLPELKTTDDGREVQVNFQI